jgi:hypothetical protein
MAGNAVNSADNLDPFAGDGISPFKWNGLKNAFFPIHNPLWY